jgi:hypothetical protein
MNKCVLQFWEESEKGWGIRPDGCTIHLNERFRDSYISKIYSNRSNKSIPKEYDRPVGNPIECFISDSLYEKVDQIGTIRLMEQEKNNLIKMEEIIMKK